MGLLSPLFAAKSTDYKAMIKQGAIVVDVRSPQEYAGGHIQRSINIPLDQISTKTDMLLKKGRPVSPAALADPEAASLEKLKSAGIDAYNADAWDSLKQKI